MDPLDLLHRAAAEFQARLDAVNDDDWQRPTPCTDWSVGDLVDHVLGGNLFTVRILAGDTVEAAMAEARSGVIETSDRAAATIASARAQRDAFDAPGALDRICHHPVGDVPGSAILGFRITDLTVHGWDLARAIGAAETLDPALVGAVWSRLSDTADAVAATGLFGDGPSGDVGEEAPIQVRLLDLTGRRP